MGRDEYRFAEVALRAAGLKAPLKVAISFLCASMAVLAWLVELHPLGPHGVPARVIHLLVSLSVVAVAVWWLVGRWPSYAQAIAFVIWADVSVAIAAAVLSAPQSRICATIHMGLIGLFAGFFLGKRVLGAHCVLVVALIIALNAYSVSVDHVGWFDLYIYDAPVLSSVVVLPVLLQVAIERGRRLAHATTRDAFRDPMTGLYNRRGMYAATRALATGRDSSVLVAAVIDLDRFKDLNDTHGHNHGDAAIGIVTQALTSCVRSGDIVARIGGDEFVAIAALDTDSGVGSFIDRIRKAAQQTAPTITASIGIAVQHIRPAPYSDDTLNAVLRHADSAMYDAKRQGGNHLTLASTN